VSSNFSVTPTLPVENLARARQFYEDKLGLKPLITSSSGVLYECGTDTKLLIYESKAANEKYEMPDISIVDELTSLSTGNVVSFQDSEGNILALVQMGMLLEANGVLSPFRK